MRSILLATLFVCIANNSFACSPAPGKSFDQLTSDVTVIGVAEVTSITITPSGEEGSCFSANYSVIESILGKFPNTVEVKSCFDDTSPEQLKTNNTHDIEMGFVAGASVLVGLVRLRPNKAVFRYAVPSCFGLHVRLDTMSNEERSELVEGFREKFSGQ